MEEREPLSESFHQSRREFWVMVGIWGFFAAWTLVANSLFAGNEKTGEIALLFGMPAWVIWGVALPWVLALATTIWFAMRFMKDTALDEEGSE